MEQPSNSAAEEALRRLEARLDQASGAAERLFAEAIPPDLERRLVEALRDLLLALRALIDWYLERLDRRVEDAEEVEEIPID